MALTQVPYNLAQGAEVKAQVQSYNVNGWSALSPLTSSGVLVQVKPHKIPSIQIGALTDEE